MEAKSVEYFVRCFDRMLTVVFAEPVDVYEVNDFMESAYLNWHSPEGCESSEDELAIVSTPCEEYIVSCLEDFGYKVVNWKSEDDLIRV